MKFMNIIFVFVNLVMSAMNLSEAIVYNQSNNMNNVGTYKNNLNKRSLITNNEQETFFRHQTENQVYYYPLQPEGNISGDNIIVPLKKIVVPGLENAEGENLMELLDETLKEGKFAQYGDILDLLILLYKSLETAQLSNEKHRQILKNLGNVLAEGHPKTAYYKNTLKLLGEAIRHDKFLENDLQETLRFVGKVVEKNNFTDEEAAEILIAMLIHNLRLGPHHYKRLGLEADQPKNVPLQKLEMETPKKCKKCKMYKMCKLCKICKKHKNGKKLRKKRAVGTEPFTSKSKDALPIPGSPEINSHTMMGDDPNAYIEYNNPEDVVIQPIIENQKAVNSLNNTRPQTSIVNSKIDNIKKTHFKNSNSHNDFNLKRSNHIPNQFLTRDNSENLRAGVGTKVQDNKSKDGDVKPQTITDKPHSIRSQNRIILTFNIGRSRL